MSWSGPFREKVKSSVLNGLSQYLMTNTILDSIFDQPKSKPPQPSTLLTENHSLPYLILIPSKPQTHSSTYKPEGPRRRVDFGVDRRWSLSPLSLSLVVFAAAPWCG